MTTPFPDNPIDTEQQRTHERLALALFESQRLQQQYGQVRQWWLDAVQPSQTMRGCFDAAFEEVMFGAVIWALNQDPSRPKVITISRLAHGLDNLRIPGSRWGIDNPDSVYRVIPVSADHRYRIVGRVAQQRMLENYFTLWDDNMQTLGLLSGHDLQVDAEGRFAIEVNSDSSGAGNHIHLPPGAKEFYIRDVINDWAGDRANELAVERLDGDGSGYACDDELLAVAEQYMQRWAENTTRWNNQALHKPVNAFDFTIDRDSDGALRNQIYIMGHYKLPDANSALLLKVRLGGAQYFIAPITNVWGTSNIIDSRNGSLNLTQMRPDPDGNYTIVLSQRDPGVYNWLDPSDMDEGILTLRWAEFVDGRPDETLGADCELVELAQLDAILPAGTPRIDAGERERALRRRAESYGWRLG